MYILGIIPARANSEGLSHKNTRLLGNKPLIQHTIELSQKCPSLTKTVICTNDNAVMEIAKGNNIIMEPGYLAKSDVSMVEVLKYTVQKVEWIENVTVDMVVLLDPTSPFRRIKDVEDCITKLKIHSYDSVVTVCEFSHNPFFVGVTIENGIMKPMIEGRDKIITRQEAPKAYRINAGVYAITRQTLMEKNKIFTDNTGRVIMPKIYSSHIDDFMDLQYAEFLLEKQL